MEMLQIVPNRRAISVTGVCCYYVRICVFCLEKAVSEGKRLKDEEFIREFWRRPCLFSVAFSREPYNFFCLFFSLSSDKDTLKSLRE